MAYFLYPTVIYNAHVNEFFVVYILFNLKKEKKYAM